MVLGMAEQCGGNLILTSVPGSGTTAELWLKVAKDGVAPCVESAAEPELGRSLDVLVVDDDLIVLMNAVAMLEDMGHRVHEAVSGKAALEVLREHSVDLLITDYAMPGMNGVDLADAAQALHPNLKVAMVSGYADLPQGVEVSMPRLAKPYDDSDLRRLIVNVMGEYSNRPPVTVRH
jgi:CheY-like chemotaxis protein